VVKVTLLTMYWNLAAAPFGNHVRGDHLQLAVVDGRGRPWQVVHCVSLATMPGAVIRAGREVHVVMAGAAGLPSAPS
jgi:hypothetical protein